MPGFRGSQPPGAKPLRAAFLPEWVKGPFATIALRTGLDIQGEEWLSIEENIKAPSDFTNIVWLFSDMQPPERGNYYLQGIK